MKISKISIILALAVASSSMAASVDKHPNGMTKKPRFLDAFATQTMLESGTRVASEPECRFGLGWIYFSGACYLVTSYHETFDNARAACQQVGADLAEILNRDEERFLKKVLNAVNPKDGTDYFLGGVDQDGDGNMVWLSGTPVEYNDFVDGEPAGLPYIHMDYDLGFAWNTKDDSNDQDNGFVCKRLL